jgi:DNA invertase Pin-like site-specific DNA recombinase
MPEYVSYLRVSTQRQGISGLGIEAQRVAVERYVDQSHGKLLKEFVEIETGSGKARPIIVQSISLCRRSKATLLIAKLDRLARNVAFVSSLMESGVEFVAADAPYANRLMIHILAAFAEHERTLISDRTKAALAAAKARGVRLGVNGERLASEHRVSAKQFAETMRWAVASTLAVDGKATLGQISIGLNELGDRTREGSLWSPSTVHRLLNRLEVARSAPTMPRPFDG